MKSDSNKNLKKNIKTVCDQREMRLTGANSKLRQKFKKNKIQINFEF